MVIKIFLQKCDVPVSGYLGVLEFNRILWENNITTEFEGFFKAVLIRNHHNFNWEYVNIVYNEKSKRIIVLDTQNIEFLLIGDVE